MENLLLIFGGQSSEHDVSCMSAVNVYEGIDKTKFNITLVGITKSGKWLLTDDIKQIKDGTWRKSRVRAILSPDAESKSLYFLRERDGEEMFASSIRIDIVFPVLHGLFGEDGTMQGLFELAGIPYVGCGVLSSAVSMDKFFTKQIVKQLGIRQARFVPVFRRYLSDPAGIVEKVEKNLSYPVFVKPSNAGSSCGVSKVRSREELIPAIELAAKHDKKILVEEAIVGRELECAVFSDGEVKVSGVGEVLAAAEFYDYDAKYNNAESETVLGPHLPEGVEKAVRIAAARIFNAVDGYGLSRVDFFLEDKTNEVVFNEINTLPGFTAISMYPMLFEAAGISKKDLVEKLIASAKKRELSYTIKAD